MKIKMYGWSLIEISEMPLFQFKGYLEAIGRKEKREYKMNALISRAAFTKEENFNNFIKEFDNNESIEKSLTDEEMKNDFGFGKKG